MTRTRLRTRPSSVWRSNLARASDVVHFFLSDRNDRRAPDVLRLFQEGASCHFADATSYGDGPVSRGWSLAKATTIAGALPYARGTPSGADPPRQMGLFQRCRRPRDRGPRRSLIPPDPETPGGKDAGCAVFIDRQLAGPYGRRAAFTSAAVHQGTKQQGPQTRTVRRSNIARRWPRSTALRGANKPARPSPNSPRRQGRRR